MIPIQGLIERVTYECHYCGQEQGPESTGCCGESSAHFDEIIVIDGEYVAIDGILQDTSEEVKG